MNEIIEKANKLEAELQKEKACFIIMFGVPETNQVIIKTEGYQNHLINMIQGVFDDNPEIKKIFTSALDN